MSRMMAVAVGLIIIGMAAWSGSAVAKVGLSSVPEAQRKEMWKLIDQFAQLEAIMAKCARSSKVERQVTAAMSPCVTAKALGKIRQFYRQRLKRHKKSLPGDTCSRKEVRRKLPKMRKAVNQVVANIKNMCATCLFC